MIEIRAEILGLKEILGRFRHAPEIVRDETRKAMTRAALEVEGEAKGRAPKKTGTLRRSLHSEVQVLAGEVRGLVGTDLVYAPYVEFGTGVYHEPDPHEPWEVTPKQAKALAFKVPTGVDPMTGRASRNKATVIVRRVVIQGMRARPYLAKAFEAKRAQIEAHFHRAAENIARRLAGK